MSVGTAPAMAPSCAVTPSAGEPRGGAPSINDEGAAGSVQGRKLLEHFRGGPVRPHVVPGAGDLAAGVHQECRANHSHGLLAVQRLLAPCAVTLHHFVVDVGEQWEPQLVLGPEPRVLVGTVR